MARHKRRQLMVDAHVQGALVVRVIGYWFYCLVTVAFMMTCWVIFAVRPTSSMELVRRVWGQCGPAFFASLLLLPLVMVDCIRLTHRFVGPLHRIRKALRDLAAGSAVPNIAFRKSDFWNDLADDFNRLNEHIRKLEVEAGRTPATASADAQAEEEQEPVEIA